MDEFLKMDVFFAVATAAVILITALSCGVLVFLMRFLHTLNRIAVDVEEETEAIRADLSDLRKGMSKGFRLVPLFSFFGKAHKRLSRRTKKS